MIFLWGYLKVALGVPAKLSRGFFRGAFFAGPLYINVRWKPVRVRRYIRSPFTHQRRAGSGVGGIDTDGIPDLKGNFERFLVIPSIGKVRRG